MEAGLAAMESWWQYHQASLPVEQRDLLGRLVAQIEICLQVAAAPTAPTATNDDHLHESAPSPETAFDHARAVEPASWIDLIAAWSGAEMAVAGARPEPPREGDSRESHESDDVSEPLRRFRDEHEDALRDYLACLQSVSAQTLNDAREAQGHEQAPVEEEPLRDLYGRLMRMGEARYLELAGSQDYALLLARLVNTLLRWQRAQKEDAAPP